MSPSTSTRATTKAPTFADIGVRPVINCMGTYTFLSGSRALPQVVEAMAEATNHYVEMDELMEKVGERLAELTGAPWGYIPDGCAAGLAQIAAACIAGADPEKMTRLPDTEGLKNEIIMQKRHRNAYDWALRMTGARMITVETLADLKAAINDRTALIALTGRDEDGKGIPIPTMIAVAREHGIPCLVDAAAERPDVPNRYLSMGADVVLYSGGKCLRGPQASGLALGRKDILQAAFTNGAPHHALGRPMKCGKEEIMGLLAAVEAWLKGRDHVAEWKMWEGYLAEIDAAAKKLPSVKTQVIQPGLSNHAPTLLVSWDPAVLHITAPEAHRELIDGNPRVYMHLVKEGLRVMPYMMEDGDAAIAAKRLSAVLASRPTAPAKPSEGVPASVVGCWVVDIQFVLGSAKHSVQFAQDGTALTGTYRSQFSEAPVDGEIHDQAIKFGAVLGYQVNRARYAFTGTVSGNAMHGEVALDEFGKAQWKAERVS